MLHGVPVTRKTRPQQTGGKDAFVAGLPFRIGRRDAENHLDMGAVDLDPTNHGPDDVALAHSVEIVEPSVHLGREALQPADEIGRAHV